uniref:Uncharacterized protein n=1 Tax=viral metagenome TaxID=1070528 RepID=A0A6C0CSI1_9ZZZZ
MATVDYKYMQVPAPITNHQQEKFGGLELSMNACTVLSLKGDIIVEGKLKSNASFNPACISFDSYNSGIAGLLTNWSVSNASIHSASALGLDYTNLNFSASRLKFSSSYISVNASAMKLNYIQSASSTSLAPAFTLPSQFFSGRLQLTPIQNTSSTIMYVLCML